MNVFEVVWELFLCWQVSLHAVSLSLSLGGMGERIRRPKARKNPKLAN